MYINRLETLLVSLKINLSYYNRSPYIEADYVKVFYNESTQTFQTQDSFTSKKINPNTGKRCNLQVKILCL